MILAERLLQVFHWPAGYPIRLVLPAMLLLSVVLHGVGLYLIRSDESARVPMLPPAPAKLTILPSEQSDNVVLATSDPSWLQPGRLREELLPPVVREAPLRALKPVLPSLVQAPRPTGEAAWVSALPPLGLQPLFERQRSASPPPALAPLTLRFDPAGPVVTEEVMERLRAAVPAQPPGLPTEFLVVLDGAGEVRHLWQMRSCGVPSVDLAAQLALQRSRFGSVTDGYRGVLRVVWGPVEAVP